MADVKWIKLATEVFDNRKIRQIECMPDGDGIIVVWFKLLCLAGTVNDSGMIYLTKDIPYTEQMLATQFNKPLMVIQLALSTFQQFGMIDIVDNILHVTNWEKYQNVDRLAEIKEYNRLAQQRSRAKRKALAAVNDMSLTCQRSQDTDIDIDKEEEKEKDIEGDNGGKPPRAPKHKYGEYKNVLLTDDELQKLKSEFSDYETYIERLSGYIESSGKKYKSHYATIRNWVRKDEDNGKRKPINAGDKKTADEWAERFNSTFI